MNLSNVLSGLVRKKDLTRTYFVTVSYVTRQKKIHVAQFAKVKAPNAMEACRVTEEIILRQKDVRSMAKDHFLTTTAKENPSE